jgi:hypothetical protein
MMSATVPALIVGDQSLGAVFEKEISAKKKRMVQEGVSITTDRRGRTE